MRDEYQDILEDIKARLKRGESANDIASHYNEEDADFVGWAISMAKRANENTDKSR